MVESTWSSDGASDRQRFLEVMVDNRSLADEPFLDAALDDRSKLVRKQAAALLALIPGSRLRNRLSAVAKTFITVRTPRGTPLGSKRRQIVLVPPESFSDDWERDGIEQRPPAGVGPRAWWMRQILGFADLAVWAELTELPPETILESLKGDDYFGDGIQALVAAATSAGDVNWSTVLVRWLLSQTSIDLGAITTLLERLADDQRESLLLEIVSKAPLTSVDRWTVLTSFDRPWSASFSAEAFKILNEHVSKASDDAWRLSRAIEAASRTVSPTAADAFEQSVLLCFAGAPADSAIRSIERARLRADMHKEFAS